MHSAIKRCSDYLSILVTNGLRRFKLRLQYSEGFPLGLYKCTHSQRTLDCSQHFCHTQLRIPIQHDFCVLNDFTAYRRSFRFPLKEFNGHSVHESNGRILGIYRFILRMKWLSCFRKNLQLVVFLRISISTLAFSSFFRIFFIA